MKLFLIVIALVFSNFIMSQNLILDSLYSYDGYSKIPSNEYFQISDLYNTNDGSFLICGNDLSTLPPPSFHFPFISVFKFDNCGNIDSSYGTNGKFDSYIPFFNNIVEAKDFFVKEDGSLLVAGSVLSYVNNNLFKNQALIKINSNGNLDSNFIIHDLTIYADSNEIYYSDVSFNYVEEIEENKILCWGSYVKQIERGILIARFDSSGNVDSTFNSKGYIEIPLQNEDFFLVNVHKTDDGQYLLLGHDNNQNLYTVKMNNYGLIDLSYGLLGYTNDSISIDTYNYSIFSDNKLSVISKDWNPQTSSEQYFIKRYLSNGATDNGFGQQGKFYLESTFQTMCIGIDIIDNQNYMIGFEYYLNPNYIGKTYFLTNDGNLDPSYGNNGIFSISINNSETAFSKAIHLQDERLILTGRNQEGALITRLTSNNLVPNIVINNTELTTDINSNSIVYYWYYNGQEIIGENSSTLSSFNNGEYIVIVTDTLYCGTFSDTLNINILRNEINEANYNLVSPNPSKNTFILNGNNTNEQYSIFDLSGRLIQNGKLTQKDQIIHCSDITAGLYILTLTNRKTSKLLITK